jgi:carbamate kinase
MDKSTALDHAEKDGWQVLEDAGRGWRRVVPSPIPSHIVQADAIQSLIVNGFVVVAVGGGGIPVIEDKDGNMHGVEAVIDKDFASSLLASELHADLFLISTAVEKVALNFNRADQKWLDHVTLKDARRYMEEGHFAKGSMGPKVAAILEYLEAGGKQAIVTNPENIERALAGETGTRFVV